MAVMAEAKNKKMSLVERLKLGRDRAGNLRVVSSRLGCRKIATGHEKVFGLFIVIVLLSVLCASAEDGAAPSAEKFQRVLILCSYHAGFSWTKTVVDAIEAELQNSGLNISHDVEYMDTKRCNDVTHYNNLYTLYMNKAKYYRYDVIIAVDNSALLFLIKYHDTLYPNVPVVFCGVDEYHGNMYEVRPSFAGIEAVVGDHNFVTGVVEAFDYEHTVEAALKLHPGACRVIVVNDGINPVLYWPNLADDDVRKLADRFGKNIEFVSFLLTESGLNDFYEQINKDKSRTVVVFANNFVDDKGNNCFLRPEFAAFWRQCEVPAYAVSEGVVTCGVVIGGSVNSSYLQGKAVVDMAARVLRGQSPGSIPIIRHSPNHYLFDYNRMKHFGISFSSLPAGSVVVNEPQSFYYHYKGRILMVVAVIAGLVFLVICLVANILRRKRAEARLWLKNIAIESSFNAVVFADLKGRIIDVNDAFLGMWGYDNWDIIIGKDVTQFWVEPQRAAEVSRRILDKGRWVGQMTAIRKDGSHFEAEMLACLIEDKNGKALCMMASVVDISDRTRAEATLRQSEERYRTLVENVDFGIVLVDAGYTILAVNSAGAKLYRKTPGELTGRQCYTEFEKRDDICPGCPGVAAMSARQRQEVEKQEIRDDGSCFFVRIQAFPVIGQNGSVVGFVKVLQDITEHKKAEDELARTEAKYQTLVEQIPAVTYIADVDQASTTAYVSPQIKTLLGYSPEDYKADPDLWRKRLHPDDCAWVMAEVQRAHKYDERFCSEYRMIKCDGSIVWIHDEAAIVKDKENRPLFLQGFMTDITDRKKAEDALRLSEEKYRRLVENLRQEYFFYSHDTNGIFVYVSPSVTTVLGFSQEEFLTHYTGHLTENPINEEVKYHSELSIKGIQQPPYEVEIYHKDGSVRRLEVTEVPVFNTEGRVAAVEGIAHDVTERLRANDALQKVQVELEMHVRQRTADLAKANEELRNEIGERMRVEKALREAEERFRTIFEDTVIGLYRTTPEGQIVMANSALVKMLGYPSFKDLVNVNLEQWGYDPSCSREAFKEQIAREGKIIGRESAWLRADGSRLFVCESAVAIKDKEGNVIYYEGSVEDITERKKAEEKLLMYQMQLRSLASELSLSEERLRRQIATDVHDHIGQNLAISKIKLESLRQSVSSGDLAKSLGEISQLISEAIKSSRTLTFELSPPVLYELGFEPALEWLVRNMRERHNISASFETDGQPKLLEHNIHVLLFQAVRELLVNVAKHAKARNVIVRSHRVRDEVRIIVEDDGVGFDASSIGPEGSDMSGYGLFSIRERLGHIGGYLDVKSKPGQGTCVTLAVAIDHPKKKSGGKKQ